MEKQDQYLEVKTYENTKPELQVINEIYIAQEVVQQNPNQEKMTYEKENQAEKQNNETGEIVMYEEKQLEEMEENSYKSQQAQAIMQVESKQLIVMKVGELFNMPQFKNGALK